jgi:energy-coupling factor transport system substrate-specific component
MKEKKSFIQGIKDQFSIKALVLIPIATGINLVGGMLAAGLKLPLFLDMIGTYVTAALAGPWVAALVGLLTNIFLALVSNPIYLPYSLVSIAVGLTVGFMMRAGLFRRVWGILLIWIVSSLVSAVVAGSITAFVFGGVTGVTGSSFLTVAFLAVSREIIASVFASAMIENLVDRAVALAIAYVILKNIPKRFRSQYSLDGMGEE